MSNVDVIGLFKKRKKTELSQRRNRCRNESNGINFVIRRLATVLGTSLRFISNEMSRSAQRTKTTSTIWSEN